jgi:hypothetical protein
MKISSFQKGCDAAFCYVQALVDGQKHTIESNYRAANFVDGRSSDCNLDDGRQLARLAFCTQKSNFG